jgi:UDP-4-amino-4,6-dideoxy-N-acetyl-beta-L-altrosamine transaminase
MIPYSCQTIDESDIAAVEAVLRAPFLTQGPAIDTFEADFAAIHAFDHAVAVCNATAALHMACLALGVGRGDRVWTSPNSFVASANCARYCEAAVDFVDIDPVTRNMSIEALEAKLALAKGAGTLPKVVIPVDFAGLPIDMKAIRQLADTYGFKIVEDASHAVGARLDGRPVGHDADITVFSFHAVKIITTAEGGLCATNDAKLADRLRLLRSHGITRDPSLMAGPSEGPWYYEQLDLGFNFRMTDIQAALGSSQLKRLDQLQASREAQAGRYDALLADLPLKLPQRPDNVTSAHHLYAVELAMPDGAARRRAVFDGLRGAGIGVNVHYIPIHLQPYYRALGFADGDFPAAEAYYAKALSLPLFPKMTEAQQVAVVDALGALL